MTLAAHIVIAGAVTKPFMGAMHPVGLFLFAMGSHYLADAIPHCDYKLKYIVGQDEKKPEKFLPLDFLLRDGSKVALDIIIGSLIIFLATDSAFSISNLIIFSPIILGAITPDIMQAVRFVIPVSILNYLQSFHDSIHGRRLPLNTSSIIWQFLLVIFFSILISVL